MQRNKFYLICSDVTACLLAFTIGGALFWQVRHSENLFLFFYNWVSIYLVVVSVAVAWFYLMGHYTRRWPYWDELRGVFQVLFGLAVVEGALIFLTKSTFPRIWFGTTFAAHFLLVPLLRVALKKSLLCLGKWTLPTAIVGCGSNAADAMQALHSEPMMGFDVRLLIDPQGRRTEACNGVPVMPITDTPEMLLARHGITCVVFALDEAIDNNGGQTLVERLQRFTQDLYIVPAMRGLPLFGMELHHFFRHEVIMIRVRNNLLRPIVQICKRSFDVIVAGLLLMILSPLLALFVFLVCRDGGPAIYAHQRVGRHGRPFRCLKFRSMVSDAESVLQQLLEADPQAREEWARGFKLKNDPRVTSIGVVLRRYSLDELPQLWNVLKGDMSLVGPRPLIAEELKRYGDQVDYYLQVRPGMTGLWQVSGRSDVDYEHRVYLDIWYVKNWSLWYDIAILFKTFKVVFQKQGAY